MSRFTPKKDKDKVEKIPAKIYTYGVIMPKESREQANELLFQAHRHKNRLIEMERGLLQEKWDFMRTLNAKYAAACDKHDLLEKKKEKLVDQARKLRILRQTKVDDPEIVKAINKQKRLIKASQDGLGSYRAEIYATDEFKTWQAEYFNPTKTERQAKARKDSGLYWGIYNLSAECVDAAMKALAGRKPDFQKFNREGRIGIQVQGGGAFRDACAGSDKTIAGLLQIDDPYPGYTGNWRNARIRVGSDDKRQPIWLEFRVSLHRDVPEHVIVRGAWLLARRTGNQVKWQLQLRLVSRDWEEKPLGKDVASLGLGWRMVADGLEVATLLGTDGRKSHLIIPHRFLNRITLARDIRSIRDRQFSVVQGKMVEWLKTASVPDWMKEKTEHLAIWKSAQRFSRVVRFWAQNRFDGDEDMFRIASDWRGRKVTKLSGESAIKGEEHLYAYESHILDNFYKWRKDHYRKFAEDLGRSYKHVVFNDLALAKGAKDPAIGENDDPDYRPPLWRDLGKQAALSYLTGAIKDRLPWTKYTKSQLRLRYCGACGKPWKGEHCGLEDNKESLCLLMLRKHLSEPDLARFFRARGIVDLWRIGGKSSKTKTKMKEVSCPAH